MTFSWHGLENDLINNNRVRSQNDSYSYILFKVNKKNKWYQITTFRCGNDNKNQAKSKQSDDQRQQHRLEKPNVKKNCKIKWR